MNKLFAISKHQPNYRIRKINEFGTTYYFYFFDKIQYRQSPKLDHCSLNNIFTTITNDTISSETVSEKGSLLHQLLTVDWVKNEK